jgi:hypothetical protein
MESSPAMVSCHVGKMFWLWNGCIHAWWKSFLSSLTQIFVREPILFLRENTSVTKYVLCLGWSSILQWTSSICWILTFHWMDVVRLAEKSFCKLRFFVWELMLFFLQNLEKNWFWQVLGKYMHYYLSQLWC